MQIILFVALACGISWLLWAPLLFNQQETFSLGRQFLYYGGVIGPAAAAVILSVREGNLAFATLRRIITRWRVPIRWYCIALLLPAAIRALSVLTLTLIDGPIPIVWRPLRGFVPFALVILVLVPFEELGWRGYALPRLQQCFSPLVASLIVGLIWGFWHLPLAWVAGGFQSSDRPLAYMVRFVVTILPISCLATWLFNSSRGSLLIVSLYHFAVDAVEMVLVLPERAGSSLLWLSTLFATVIVAMSAAASTAAEKCVAGTHIDESSSRRP